MLDFQGFLGGGGCEIRTHAPVKANGFQDLVSIWNLMELNLRKATDFGNQN